MTSNLTAVGRALAHVVGQLPLTGSELIGLQLAVALLFSGAMFQWLARRRRLPAH